ncbi:MAG: hypothetical protein IRZ14_18010 [Chloroflexi bacterium]|nr:hypothetical protein [Chloroflexota bacterium]
MAVSVQITYDCADPDRLATFWAAALGYMRSSPRRRASRAGARFWQRREKPW